MDEDTQQTEAPPTQDVATEQPPVSPETPTVEDLQAQLAEKEAKLRELGTKAETLEKIVTEKQASSPAQPDPRPVREKVDLEKESEEVFMRIAEDNDPKAAAKQFKNLLQKARSEDIEEFNYRLQVQQKVQAKANDLLSRKPHFESFKDEVYAEVERNVNQGITLDDAFRQAEGIWDKKLAGLAPQKEQPQVTNEQSQTPPKPTQGIAQHVPPVTEKKPEEESYAQYLERRNKTRWEKRTQIRS